MAQSQLLRVNSIYHLNSSTESVWADVEVLGGGRLVLGPFQLRSQGLMGYCQGLPTVLVGKGGGILVCECNSATANSIVQINSPVEGRGCEGKRNEGIKVQMRDGLILDGGDVDVLLIIIIVCIRT